MNKNVVAGAAFVILLLSAGLASAAELVNLNKATAAAIQQNLVGIGPIKAEAIISYRKKNGKFKSLNDLKSVTGIGPALIKKNKRYMSLTKGVVKGDDKAYSVAKKQAGKVKLTSKKNKSSTVTKTAKRDKKSKDKTKTAAKSSNKSTNTNSKQSKTSKPKKNSKTSKPVKKKPTKEKPVKKKKKKKTAKSTT